MGCCFRPGAARLAPLPPVQGGLQAWKGRAEPNIFPEKCNDTEASSRDHMIRQTPVCPTRQWELPPAFPGTMTSDLKFCFLAFLRSVGSEQ